MWKVPLSVARRDLVNSSHVRLCSSVVSPAAASVVKPSVYMPDNKEHMIKYYPKIGNREILCHGIGGHPIYFDDEDIPCSSVRFRPDSQRFRQLQELERGHWGDMSLEEKRESYRQSYCQTFAEFTTGHKGRWKSDLSWTIVWLGLCAIGLVWSDWVFHPEPAHLSEEGHKLMLERMIEERTGMESFGIASQYDYKKGDWKK